MAPTYKVTYFPFKALAETVRYLLSYGGVEFEDERISKEDFPKVKEDMPFGLMPVLEVNGKKAHQSVAISRYLGKQFKLTGENDWEDLEIDAMADTVNDFRAKVTAYFYETEEEGQIKKKENIDKEVIPYYLDRFEAIAKANNGHLALGKLTWVDFYFASLVDIFKAYNNRSGDAENMFTGRENVQAVIKNVENLPAIKTWFAKRPESEY